MQDNLIISALLARLEAQRLEALAILNVYATSPVGVGEHSNFIDEAAAALKKLESAVSQIEALNMIINSTNEQEQEQEEVN